MEIKAAQQMAAEFAQERAWDRNLPSQRVAHLVREVARIAEHTLHMEGMTIKPPDSDMEKQVGDVLFSLFAFANRLEIDVEAQFTRALETDAEKYPAETTKERSLERLKEGAAAWTLA